MEINAYYQIGKDHKVCEDYALCGTEPFPYAILSDGCSSVNDSDIGSRILVSMAKKTFKDLHLTPIKSSLIALFSNQK